MEPRTYVVRPFSKPARTDLKDVFRIHLSPATMLLHGLHAGDSCLVERLNHIIGPAIAWPAPEKIIDSVVQTSKTLQTLCGLKLGDRVSVLRSDVPIEDANSITLCEFYPTDVKNPLAPLNEPDRSHWSWFLEYVLEKAEYLCPGMLFENVELRGEKRSFKVLSVNSSNGSVMFRAHSISKIHIQDPTFQQNGRSNPAPDMLEMSRDGIGGLTKELEQLNKVLASYSEQQYNIKLPAYYRRRRGGVILYGPPGNGKTMLLQKVCSAQWRKVLHIDSAITNERSSDSEALVRKNFDEALRCQPSVIAIDDLQLIAGKRDSIEQNRSSIVIGLCEGLDRLGGARVLVLATTDSLAGIDASLRRPGRFELEVEIPVPDSSARTEILKVLSRLPKGAHAQELDLLGDRTHGFVGADLDRLTQLAVDKAIERVSGLPSSGASEINGSSEAGSEMEIEVTAIDLDNALLDVRPTAMREVFLETPKVKWSDIGGQHSVKEILKQAVEWPFTYPSEMERLGIEPRKGLVLYGPPGCSKTLIAKAVATEAGLNFIAVKGAELMSMYVGESERAVREVFRKARAASPSIIFFDEIDAMGASRGGPSQHGSLNVVTTLLNELDGIELLKRVFVLAATNKPEILDPALLRPGRLDSLLYVGLPDFEARQKILRIRIRKMSVDDDVDASALAEVTNGYSGAEIVSICHKAGYAALEDQVSSGIEQRVRRKHFDIAMAEVQKGITAEMIQSYEAWGAHSR